MATNPSFGWDDVPVWGLYETRPGVPDTGRVVATMTQRVTRTDGRVIYAAGAKVEARLGGGDDDPKTIEMRAALGAAWREADEVRDRAAAGEAGETFDATAWRARWDARWTSRIRGGVFFDFPAIDDPDVVGMGQVKIEERLDSGGGRTYFVDPLLAHLGHVPPGLNLGTVVVPPGTPTNPAPTYAKGIAGGVASLDRDGKVPIGQLPEGLPSAGASVDTLSGATDPGKALLKAPTREAQRTALGLADVATGTAVTAVDQRVTSLATAVSTDVSAVASRVAALEARPVGGGSTSGPSGIALDEDGVPYFDPSANDAGLAADVDGTPYFTAV